VLDLCGDDDDYSDTSDYQISEPVISAILNPSGGSRGSGSTSMSPGVVPTLTTVEVTTAATPTSTAASTTTPKSTHVATIYVTSVQTIVSTSQYNTVVGNVYLLAERRQINQPRGGNVVQSFYNLD
jgi:hypothetical protein